MNKKIENALNEKMQVKLPRELEKDNILDMLESTENTVEIAKKSRRKQRAKRLVPLAASLALVIGLLSVFGNGNFNKKVNNETGDITEVAQYQSYDKIYGKFETLHKEAEKVKLQNGVYNLFYGNAENAENFADSATGTLAGGVVNESMNEGVVTDTTAKPGASVDDTTDDLDTNRNHGTTNTQEQDVDEGDLIKTDGKYLYVTRRNNSVVSIVDIQDNKLEKISQIEIKADADIQEIYLNGKTLIIVGTAYDFKQDETKENTTSGSRVYYGADIAYGIGNLFVKVYDISNVREPKLVTEYSQQGQYENSRMIGTKLYCISSYYVNVARDDYKDYCIPETTINGVCEPVPAGCISVIEDSKSSTYAVITTLDISKDKAPESEAILGDCDNLYASSQGLFLSENDWSEKLEFTKIYRFEYTETGIEYKCMGKVPGYIKNQFAMSYDGEYFKIATTKNETNVDGDAMWTSLDGRTNNLYVLNDQMQIVGKVEGLAKGESIQSVRYIGKTAYVVTFRQTDPLFVIDLSDPTNPTVKGELKITGFSEYLHPITSTLLVGVGQDGTESGTNGDCKISLFDVSDPNKPFEASKVTVANGSASVYSPVSTNHKCFVKLSENEFAVPFTVYSYLGVSHSKPQNLALYIRYKVENGTVKEVARYNLTEQCDILGGTYVGNTFFAVVNDYKNSGFQLIAFDLITNAEINRIVLN